MRPLVVLMVLGLALLATIFFAGDPQGSFDQRYENTEERLRQMAEDIDSELENGDEGDNTDR